MPKRNIIKIDKEKCNGCGQCIPNCPEGALQIIDGKAHLVGDLFCDGLGACIGRCPLGAISIEEREAEDYDERKVMENVIRQGENVIKAHLRHLRDHDQAEYLMQAEDFLKEKGIEVSLEDEESKPAGCPSGGCPGSRMMVFEDEAATIERKGETGDIDKDVPAAKSALKQWPIQLMLVAPNAPYFNGADLLIAADCVPFAYPDFHRDMLKGKAVLVGCPKLDNARFYRDKLESILSVNDIKSVTYAHMEVPCCFGLVPIIKEVLASIDKDIPFTETVISIKGEKIKS